MCATRMLGLKVQLPERLQVSSCCGALTKAGPSPVGSKLGSTSVAVQLNAFSGKYLRASVK